MPSAFSIRSKTYLRADHFKGGGSILASGVTLVQVVANPLISMLGDPGTAASRLTFAQAFNSLGTTVFPYVGAIVILGALAHVSASQLSGAALEAYRATESAVISQAYVGIAAALAIVAAAVWMNRSRLVETRPPRIAFFAAFTLLKHPRFAFGAVGIFLYVGAEVAIASLLISFLMQEDTLGYGPRHAGEMLIFYWGGALVGRFIGAAVMRFLAPWVLLATVALGAMTLLLVAGVLTGAVSGFALLAVGLCNAIMFPTIFTLASEGLGSRAAEGSGVICMAIVGGAVIPPMTGFVADISTLRLSLCVPFACYVMIGLYAVTFSKTVRAVGNR